MPFLPVIVTPVAALFVALLESLAGCGEGTAARFAHVARAACLAGLLRIGGRCRGMLGGECERRAEHRHCGRKRRNRDRGWFENSRNLCMCHGHTLCCTVTRSHSLSLVKLTLVKLTTSFEPMRTSATRQRRYQPPQPIGATRAARTARRNIRFETDRPSQMTVSRSFKLCMLIWR
jgi:hypothetical protein